MGCMEGEEEMTDNEDEAIRDAWRAEVIKETSEQFRRIGERPELELRKWCMGLAQKATHQPVPGISEIGLVPTAQKIYNWVIKK